MATSMHARSVIARTANPIQAECFGCVSRSLEPTNHLVVQSGSANKEISLVPRHKIHNYGILCRGSASSEPASVRHLRVHAREKSYERMHASITIIAPVKRSLWTRHPLKVHTLDTGERPQLLVGKQEISDCCAIVVYSTCLPVIAVHTVECY